MQGAFAAAETPKGALLIIHENKGLNDHTRSVAGRFAHEGFSSLAIDLLSEEGGTTSLRWLDPARPERTYEVPAGGPGAAHPSGVL